MDAGQSLERAYRAEATRIRAALAAWSGDIGLAEDALQDALVAAAEHWPREGTPANPGGWLMTTARRKALDRIRRESVAAGKLALLAAADGTGHPRHGVACPGGDASADGDGSADDELLSLAFACCHPALSRDAQVTLTLRAVCGLTTGEIAKAFLVTEATMSQRLLRARKTLNQAEARVAIPDPDELGERLAGVLAVVYLVFNEGYLASSGRQPARRDLAAQAIALTRTLHRLMPKEPEVLGLLSLLLLHESRAAARFDGWGRLIRLQDQDRSEWDEGLIAQATGLLDRALALRRAGPYQVQAAIAALHAQAPDWGRTDWRQIRLLYGTLQAMTPSPVVLLNRAVATRYAVGPEPALQEIEPLGQELDGYHLFHALRAGLLTALGRDAEAKRASERALALAANPAEREHLARGLSLLSPAGSLPPGMGGSRPPFPLAPVPSVRARWQRPPSCRARDPNPGSAHLDNRAELDRDPAPVDTRPGLRDLDRLVHGGHVQDRKSAEDFFGLDERAVGDPGAPDGLGGRRGLQLRAAVGQLPGRPHLLVPGRDLAEPLLVGLVLREALRRVHDQHHVLHDVSLCCSRCPARHPLTAHHEWGEPRSDKREKIM
jgi:RNA polymerase sigma factor (sigma-70 family)